MEIALGWIILWIRLAFAQFPQHPHGLKTVRSEFNEDVTLDYKENTICETTSGVRSFSGYVRLPPNTLQPLGINHTFPINSFFWYFEAREDPENAPLAIWLNGGPGSSSLLGALRENGPCFVQADSNSTVLNEWSWNNEVNMLYIDQPVQTGLSYDTLRNATLELIDGGVSPLKSEDQMQSLNTTLMAGTMASGETGRIPPGATNAAYAMWYFLQVWTQEFPEYKTSDKRISLAAESYGGRYAPAMFEFFQQQNERIQNGTWKMPGFESVLTLDTLIIVSGIVDGLIQWPSYPMMAFNNTYGIQAVSPSIHELMLKNLDKPDGCFDKVHRCHEMVALHDSDNTGKDKETNEVCSDAAQFCNSHVQSLIQGYNYYDITTLDPSEPAPFASGFMNQPHVLQDLGAPLNWTAFSSQVKDAFDAIGDYARPGWLDKLAYLLKNGMKVALIYGDKDYICNWIGGEAVSLAINYTHAIEFREAKYADIQTNNDYVGGHVRQFGNLSFSRVFQAGHLVPYYQPETSYQIFMRALNNLDIASGTVPVQDESGNMYTSKGIDDSFSVKNEVQPQQLQVCYVLDIHDTCNDEQISALRNGSAVVRNFMIVDRKSTELYPDIVRDGSDTSGSSHPCFEEEEED